MKFLIPLIVGSLGLMLAFQNCSQPQSTPQNEASSALSQNVSSSSANKISLSSENLNVINFFIDGTQSVTRAGNVFSIKYIKTFK